MGSPGYLAPELLTHGEAAPTMDVYAAGVMLFEMVTGRHPFTGESGDRHRRATRSRGHPGALDLRGVAADRVRRPRRRSRGPRPCGAPCRRRLRARARSLPRGRSWTIPTLDRRADAPSGALAITRDPDATTVLNTPAAGATVALPVGIGRPFASVGVADGALLDADPEAIEPEPAQRRAWWWVGAIIAILLLLGRCRFWWYQAIGPGAYTTVPSVVNDTEENATRTLTSVGFTVTTEKQNDDNVVEGSAIGTDPGAQQRAQRGSEVTLIISLGPTMTKVPSVVGVSESEANATLKDNDFPLADPIRTYSDTVPKGEVMSSKPKAGESVRHDPLVTLEVSNGPEPITVPKVTDMTVDDARAALAPLAMEVTVVHERTDKADAGIVFKQDPKANADGIRTERSRSRSQTARLSSPSTTTRA